MKQPSAAADAGRFRATPNYDVAPMSRVLRECRRQNHHLCPDRVSDGFRCGCGCHADEKGSS